MRKRQQKLGVDFDRLSVIVSAETGNRIRELADRQGLSISNFIARAVSEKLDKIEKGGKQ